MSRLADTYGRRRAVVRSRRAEDGYSLVESGVAVALLLTAAAPLAALLAGLTLARPAAQLQEALQLARTEMEATLRAGDLTRSATTERLVGTRWRVTRTITRTGDRAHVAVRVARTTDAFIFVELQTVRLL